MEWEYLPGTLLNQVEWGYLPAWSENEDNCIQQPSEARGMPRAAISNYLNHGWRMGITAYSRPLNQGEWGYLAGRHILAEQPRPILVHFVMPAHNVAHLFNRMHSFAKGCWLHKNRTWLIFKEYHSLHLWIRPRIVHAWNVAQMFTRIHSSKDLYWPWNKSKME